MYTKDIRGPMSIDTLDQYCRSTLDWYLIDTPSTPQMTLYWHSIDILVNSRLISDRCTWVSWHLTNYRPTVEQVLNECIKRDVNQVPIKMSIKGIDWHGIVDAFSTHDPIIDIYLSPWLEIEPWRASVNCCHNCHCQWFTCQPSFSSSSSSLSK